MPSAAIMHPWSCLPWRDRNAFRKWHAAGIFQDDRAPWMDERTGRPFPCGPCGTFFPLRVNLPAIMNVLSHGRCLMGASLRTMRLAPLIRRACDPQERPDASFVQAARATRRRFSNASPPVRRKTSTSGMETPIRQEGILRQRYSPAFSEWPRPTRERSAANAAARHRKTSS